jgi:hypothetical protein
MNYQSSIKLVKNRPNVTSTLPKLWVSKDKSIPGCIAVSDRQASVFFPSLAFGLKDEMYDRGRFEVPSERESGQRWRRRAEFGARTNPSIKALTARMTKLHHDSVDGVCQRNILFPSRLVYTSNQRCQCLNLTFMTWA